MVLWLVLALTNKGYLVFDPFMGVGTKIIEALKLERLRSEQYGDEYATGLRGVAANQQENRYQLKQLQQKE